MGINARASLHPRWSGHNVRTIDGFKTCEVRITRRLPNTAVTYNPATKTYNDPNTLVYEGVARMQPYGINEDIEVGLDPTARRLMLVQVQGKNLEINNDDVLEVISSPNNTDLLNYRYDVRGSIGSSVEWGTNLVVEVNLKMVL
jgi:hypothetical protein